MSEFRPVLAAHDLTEQQWRVLRALVDRRLGLGVGELAERTFLLAPSVSRIVAALEARGLISRSADERDARRSRLVVTRKGVRVFDTIGPQSEAVYAAMEERLGTGDLEQLYALLDRLAAGGADAPGGSPVHASA